MAASPGRRPQRRSPLVVAALIAGLLVVAFAASRTLQREGQRISKEEAITIAEQAAGFDADQEVVRFLRRGVPPRSHWAVSLSERSANGPYELAATVLIDATNGAVVQLTPAG